MRTRSPSPRRSRPTSPTKGFENTYATTTEGRGSPIPRTGSPSRSLSPYRSMSPSRIDGQVSAAEVDPEMVRASLRDFVQQLATSERERVRKFCFFMCFQFAFADVCVLFRMTPLRRCAASVCSCKRWRRNATERKHDSTNSNAAWARRKKARRTSTRVSQVRRRRSCCRRRPSVATNHLRRSLVGRILLGAKPQATAHAPPRQRPTRPLEKLGADRPAR